MKQSITYITLLSLINFGVVFGLSLASKPISGQILSQQQSKTTLASNPQPTTVSTGVPRPTPDSRCLIKIDNHTYDVTTFRRQHSGGNIFVCGTDMSVVFHDQHNSDYIRQISRYEI
jgi:cytochrome b involved in lipid metabolism